MGHRPGAGRRLQLDGGRRAVALFEAGKGALVLLAGFGLLALVHRDLQHVAERLVASLHLNPASKLPRIFIDAAAQATDAGLWMLAALAALYAAIRFAEAYGLWRARAWAEWLGAISGGIYVPFEVVELSQRFTLLRLGTLVGNLLVVAFLGLLLWRRRLAGMRPARP